MAYLQLQYSINTTDLSNPTAVDLQVILDDSNMSGTISSIEGVSVAKLNDLESLVVVNIKTS